MDYILIGAGIVVLVIVVYLITWVISTYNRLINLRMNADRQSSHVEVHLKKKFDMIPALVNVVKGYAKHESGTFEEVTRLRSQWAASKDNIQKVRTANMLESALSKLLVIQERYPRLKADRNFIRLQDSISHVENELVHERKVYNKRISWYNVKLQMFPSSLIAKLFGFEEKPFFQLGNGESSVGETFGPEDEGDLN